jgi:predicted ATP-grasp superfamily ATP-dependent carboligase
MRETLLIVGASARAAAFSALRAGLRPSCADLFADADLQSRCPVLRLTGRYPHAFLDRIDAAPGPWMYTGGLENWPGLVRRMAERRPLWGNDAAALGRCRNPWFVCRALRTAGLPAPAVRRRAPSSGRWLVKPLGGSGGRGIRFWDQSSAAPGRRRAPVCFQKFIDGTPVAAVYVADGERSRLLGVTRQLVGQSFLHAAPFHYCGSIGPLLPPEDLRRQLERLGDVLAARCGLRGLFGVDGVLRGGAFWPVEINPRYTASVEVLEHARGLRALAEHAHVFIHGALAPAKPQAAPLPSPGSFIGKAILFARAALVFPAEGPWQDELRSPTPLYEVPAYADIPAAGQPVEAGRPILTFFARADSAAACEDALRRTAADLDRRLFGR